MKNKLIVIIFIMAYVLFGYDILYADKMRSPSSISINSKVYYSKYTNTGWAYRFYKKFISPIRGNQCPMYPSCSTYAKDAFEKYGFFRGFVMMSDRLTRCGQDLHKYEQIFLDNREYSLDSVKTEPKINKL